MTTTTRNDSENSVLNEPTVSLRKVEVQRGAHFRLMVDQLVLQTGRTYLLNGPNGSGKSSLLHVLALLLAPDRGEIFFAGKPVQTTADKQRLRRQVTLVEQDPLLFDTTVYNNLAFGLRLRQISGHLQHYRITRALQSVGLPGFESRPAKELSGGEVRRVALARALVVRPRVLLLDEPASDLDSETLPLLEAVLVELTQSGVTVVLSSHHLLPLGTLVAETVSLDAGKLVAATESSQVMEVPQCRSV